MPNGMGLGRGLRGKGGGRMGGFGLVPRGECVCQKYSYKIANQRGISCYQQKIPNGTAMTRR